MLFHEPFHEQKGEVTFLAFLKQHVQVTWHSKQSHDMPGCEDGGGDFFKYYKRFKKKILDSRLETVEKCSCVSDHRAEMRKKPLQEKLSSMGHQKEKRNLCKSSDSSMTTAEIRQWK